MNSRRSARRPRASPGPRSARCRGPRARPGRRSSGRGSPRGSCAPRAAAARWRWTSSGKTSPSARTREGPVGQLEAGGERAHADLDRRALAHREAVLAQHVAQAVGAAGVAEEEHASCPAAARGRRRARAGRPRSGAPGGGPRAAPRAARGRPRARGARASRGARAAPRPGTSASAGSRRQRVAAALAVLARAGVEALGLLDDALRLERRPTCSRGQCCQGGDRWPPATSGSSSAQLVGRQSAALDALQRARAARDGPRSARGSARRSARRAPSAARTTSERGRISSAVAARPSCAACRGRSARRLSIVSPKNSTRTGRVAVGREDVEDAAAARHLAGARDRVLAPVAALVERLEQDLRRHLVARRAA